MASEAGVKKVLGYDGEKWEGRRLEIHRAEDKKPQKEVPVFSLFVKNLPLDASEASLREAFKSCGKILGVRLPVHQDSGKLTGFGFVDFASNSARRRALSLGRPTLGGRQLLLANADEKKSRR